MSATPATPAIPSARPVARTLLPLLAVAALLALVFLLPTRDEQAVEPGQDRLATVIVELADPPQWARDRGRDEVVRSLDRLDWGSHASINAARIVLAKHKGTLAAEIVARLAVTGDRDPPLASRLVDLLGSEDPLAPGVLDELVRRALSYNGLEARAGLRVLAHVDHPGSVNAVRTRLFDQDPEIVGFARGALAELARRGNSEAREEVLRELEQDTVDVDLAYLTVTAGFPRDERTDTVLRSIAGRGQGTVRLIALTALVARDDPDAIEAFETMLREGDYSLKVEVLRAAATAGRVLGQSEWTAIMDQDVYPQSEALVRVLLLAYDTGHPDAARALELLEREATSTSSTVQADVLQALFRRRHPNVIEGLRSDIQRIVGARLVLVVDCALSGPDELPSDKQVRADLAELGLERLRHDEQLSDPDRVLLCRLVAGLAPEASADLLVDWALGRGVSRLVSEAVADLLPSLGAPGLQRLARELGTPAGDALIVWTAANARHPAALPLLKELLCAPGTAPDTRRAALDAFGFIPEGPREEVLRSALPCLQDEALKQRAQLVFWNYL